MGSIADKYIEKINQGSNSPTEKPNRRLSIADKYINKINESNDLPAETAIPPVAAISEPSPITDMPPVDPTGGFRSPTSGVTETNALLAQQIADQNRAAQIADAPNTTELDSVFYPKTFDPAVTGQQALETERQRLADVMEQPGPTIAKTEANVNPSISQVQGLPGNYTTTRQPVSGMPISDAAAIDEMAFGNTYQMPNNAISRGTGRMLGVFNLFAQQLGLKDTGDYIDRMQELNRIIPEAPKDVQDGLRAITDENNTWGEAFRAMKDNPGAVLSVVGESIPQMIPSLLAATGTTLATGGNIFAGAAAVGATSGAIEFGNVLDEEIRSSGVDLNDDAAVQELFDNPEFWGRARERGARRGIAIGLFDALSMGMAGKLVNMAKVRGSGRLGVGGAATAELAGVQGPLGSVGEFGAQLLEQQGGFRDGLNLGEIALEGVAEIVPGAGEVAISTTAGGDPVALAAKQTMRDIDNAEFATTPEQEAIALLQPQDMLLEEQIVDLQMRLRSLGQDKLASVYGTWLDRLDTITPKNLTFLRTKVEEEERKAAGVASLSPRVENVMQDYLAKDDLELAQFNAAMSDPRTKDVMEDLGRKMQMIGDRLHELGYDYKTVASDPSAPAAIKKAREFLSNGGIAMRLMKQLNANVKGYKGNRQVTDEDLNKTIGRLQNALTVDVKPLIESSVPNPSVQSTIETPAAPVADGPIQPPSANSQPVNLANPPDLPPQPAAPSPPSVDTEAPRAPAAQDAPAQPKSDAKNLANEYFNRARLNDEEIGKFSAAAASIKSREQEPDVPSVLTTAERRILEIQTSIAQGTATSNEVNEEADLKSLAESYVRNTLTGNTKAAELARQELAELTSTPVVKTETPTAPDVRNVALPKIQVPVAEEAPTVNPQEAEPVGREVPSKPVTSVQTPDGQAKFNVQGRVIELADLKQATGDLQPRDRSRKESAALAKERAGSMFNPARLLDDPTSGSGAPIIARDGTIMSGNGRVLTMQEVYASQSDSLASYRAALEDAGINTEGFSQPVFVRQLADDMTVQELKRFADLSNTEAQAQMSMTERASRDSTRLTDSGIIDLFRGDFDIGSAQNREFVSEYAKKILSPTEQGAFVRPDGSPSAEGLTRIRNSILASAFDDADTLAIMLESTDDNIKAIGNSFMATAPKFAQLKKQVADGRTDGTFDITPKLSEMANLISRLRSEGVKPRDFYNQDSMFDVPDPEVRELVEAFYNDDLTKPNSMKAMKEFLDFYVDEALQKETGGLIPDDTTAQDIIDQGRRRTEEKKSGTRQNQQGLFEAASNVESPNARSKQVQKRTNAPSRQKPQRNERARIEADEVGTTSDVNEVAAMTPGTVFEQVSQTTRQSIYRDAFADSGLSADAIENKSTQQKFAILSRIVSKKFGIAAVTAPEEGAGYTQVNQLLDAYHNLQWMTHSLAMPNTFIGLDGQLKLEMPDKVTRFLGAFYPNANTIVMPQRSNSFAHEFGHALDYYLMDRYGNPDQMSRDTRGVSGLVRATQKSGSRPWLDGTPRNVEAAFGNMINALFLDNADLSLKIMSLEQQIAKSEAFEAKTGRKTKKLTQLREQLRKLSEGSGRSKVGSSEYSQTSATYGARERKVDYYLRPTEMFARAFEAYIAQKVEAAGGRNEFITKGDDAYKLAAEQVADADIRLAETFPKDHERHNIMLAMDQLIDALRNESIAQGTVAEAPGDTDMIDARGAFWTTQAYEERGSILSAPKRVVQKIITDQKRASQIAANNAQAMKLRPNQFSGDTSFSRKLNEYRDTYGTNFIWTKRQILLTLSDRYNPTVDANGKKTGGNAKVRRIMEDIISKVATDPGTRQDRVTAAGGTFEEATRIEARRFYAVYDRIANEFNMDKLTDADQKTLRLLLTGDENTTLKASPEMVRLAAELRKKLLNPIYDYMVKNGQDVNYVQDVGYMPRMLDAPLAIQEVSEFLGELDGSKGAIPLYQQVIFDNEYGDFMEGDIDQMKALVSLALSNPNKTSVGAEIASNYSELSEIAKQMRETLKEIDNLNKAIEEDTGDADIDGLEATIEELSATLNDLHGELHLELRNPYAIAAGKDWHNRVAVREGSDPSTNGVQGSFAKKRKLPSEADRYMNDFYLNPTDAIMQYIPSAVRATEYSTRFGRDLVPEGSKMKEGRQIDYLEYQLDEAKLAGMKTHEAQEVKTIVDMVTGRYPGPDNLLARGLNNLNTLGTMALLPRAVLSGIAEPITAAVQTGSVVKGFQNFALALDGLGASLRGKSAVERKMYYSQLASVLGVIDLPQTGEVVANRLGGTSAEDSKNTARLALFFLRTGLVNMTIAQRKASMRVGMQFLIEQSAQYRNTKISETLREEARQTLQDFGVRPEQMDAFTDFAQNLDKTEAGLYEINQIMDVDGSLTDMGRILATATNRFVDQTIQDPKIIDRPKWAERPMGRIVYGIQAFIATFQRNVLEMSVKRFARDYTTKGAYKAIAPKALGGDGSLFGKMLLPLTSLYIGHTLSSAVREFIFNRDKWDQEAEDEDRDIPIKYLAQLGISRSGFLGRADPLFNGFFSLKYQADLSNILAGATGSYYLKAIQRIAGLGVENSPNTVSREYQALRGFYDIAVPMLGGRLATMPGVSNFFGYGLGMADMAITSPSAKHWVLRNTIKLSHGVEYRPGEARRKSGSGSSGGSLK